MQEVCICYQACAHFLFKSSIWGLGIEAPNRGIHCLGICGISYLFLHTLYLFFSKKHEHGFFTYGNKWNAGSSFSIHSFPPISLPPCIGCLAVCVSPYYAIFRLCPEQRAVNKSTSKATWKSKRNSDKRPCLC